jgi:hypothetical protein
VGTNVHINILASHFLLQAKIPDIEKCLDIVAALQAKKALGEVCMIYIVTLIPLFG